MNRTDKLSHAIWWAAFNLDGERTKLEQAARRFIISDIDPSIPINVAALRIECATRHLSVAAALMPKPKRANKNPSVAQR